MEFSVRELRKIEQDLVKNLIVMDLPDDRAVSTVTVIPTLPKIWGIDVIKGLKFAD